MIKIQNSKSCGFTLAEMLVVVAIALILFGLVLYGFMTLRKSHAVDSTRDQIESLVSEARSKTLSSEEESQYGVHFETGRIVLFKGGTFTEPSPDNKEIAINKLVEISGISLNGGGSDIVFERLTGKTDQYGTITANLKSDAGQSVDVSVSSAGVISSNFN